MREEPCTDFGVRIAVGRGPRGRGAAEANGIEPGDKVLYPRESGYDVRLGGIDVKVLKRKDLIARVHD